MAHVELSSGHAGVPGSMFACAINYLNLYFRGRSLARIVGRRRHPAKLEIHHKYVVRRSDR